MSALPTFPEFFHAVHGHDPFPWQTMLAEQVCSHKWRDGFPDAVDLPTASGKTACIDIAVYALAVEADQSRAERTAARRIWFVVDRRIVVDEAFERAEKLAKALENPVLPVLRSVTERLLNLRGLNSRKRPLAVGRLRGGVLRDDGWARIPSQAAIITSTVDQLGSRLLFRGYGYRALAAPIFAGLAANDSLILLDEAHCAVPFLQTLRAVKMFRSNKWSEEQNAAPFHVTVLSATPPGGEEDGEAFSVFPENKDRAEALNHPLLQTRLTASKRTELKTVTNEDDLTSEIACAAEIFARRGTMRIGIIVNRVARATEIAALLSEKARENAPDGGSLAIDVKLLTGRIRPLERDAVVEELHPILHSSSKAKLDRPLILVSTQCLEVGADFSFDALVTECASLDALRQRFGRLARLGTPERSEAIIIAAENAFKKPDPIYGTSMQATWKFLLSKADVISRKEGKKVVKTRIVDFGFETLREMLPSPEDMQPMLAPASDAPILLPAYLDLLCQTAPLPHPNPDIGIFLHGKGRTTAEVRVAVRCDLDPQHPEQWPEIASLCRPVGNEMFSVPLYRLRSWLSDGDDLSGDVEGELAESDKPRAQRSRTKFLIVRGHDDSRVCDDPAAIYPDATILLPSPRNMEELSAIRQLGQVLSRVGLGNHHVDLWELALIRSGKPTSLRLHRKCLAPWLGENGCTPLRQLMGLIETSEPTAVELRDALEAVRNWIPDGNTQALPTWLMELFESTKAFRFSDIAYHPGGGIIIYAKKSVRRDNTTNYFEDDFEDDSDFNSNFPEAASLAVHCAQVAREAFALGNACLDAGFASLLRIAGQWHDAGKLDERFQEVLRNGAPSDGSPPLAKSRDKPRSKEHAKAIALAAGLPGHFRHEMLSVQLAEKFIPGAFSERDRSLLLHLIASHHGHARPFAPVCDDPAPPPIISTLAETSIALSSEERSGHPAHRLDSGISDRFWQMTRRFGWWGICYREALLRLADWHASEHPDKEAASKS